MRIGDFLVADWFVYASIVIICVIFGVIFWWFYTSRLKIGYKAVFSTMLHGVEAVVDGKVTTVGGVRVCLGEKEFKASDKDIVWKGQKYKVDMTKPAYRWFGWTRFYYDIITGDILTFGGRFEALNPNDGDLFLCDGLIRRMTMFVGQRPVGFLAIILVLVVMAIVAYALGVFTSPYILPPSNVTVVAP